MQQSLNASRDVRARARNAALAIAVVSLAACDIPTSAPIVDSRWIVPGRSAQIGVENFLPSGVTIAPDSGSFIVAASPASFTRRLADDCTSCVAANGFTMPKPAFTLNTTSTSALPADVSSATLVSGSVRVLVTNTNTFDPLRPSADPAAARGFAIITITNGSAVLGRDSVDGANVALPGNGGTLTRTIALAGRVSGSAPLSIAVVLNSPAGDPVLIDDSRTVSVTFTPTDLRLASASVNVAGRAVSTSTSISLSDVDSTVTNHVTGGALLMNVANPFGVAGSLTARFVPDGGPAIEKPVALTAGNSTPFVSFTASELRALLGHTVTLTIAGNVSSASPAAIAPKQAVTVSTQLDVELEIGGAR